MHKKLLNLFIFILLHSFTLQGQYTIIGNGAFASNAFGPIYSSFSAGSASRFAYIYDAGDLGMLQHGDSIFSIAFFKATIGPILGTGNMKIFIRPTRNSVFDSTATDWPTETSIAGTRKVYDKTPFTDIGVGNGMITFTFDNAYVWDTTFGFNFQLMVEYVQDNAQNSNFLWRYDSPASQATYAANQTKYFIGTNRTVASDTLLFLDSRKPQIRINYPRYNIEIATEALYSLGKIPAPLGNPDTVKVLLENNGKQNVTNRMAFLHSKGANNFTDTLLFSLNTSEKRLFSFPIRNITQVGMDTLTVILAPDSLSINDTIWNLREATSFTYSYRNLLQPPAPGGIGFNGNTGDFVAKFQSTQQKAINQIEVVFGFGPEPFKLGIWDANGRNGTPGNLIWESDTQTSVSGTFTLPVWPPVNVSGSFFVGVRQVGLSNIAFGYQPENPVRNGTFFYAAPIGDTNWVDFSPGAPFRFLIEPRIQAENDVTPVSINFPSSTDTLFFGSFDTIAPKATIRNIGVNDQTVAFETRCEIRFFGGQLMYSSSVFDTLSAGNTKEITFEKSFFPINTGTYRVDVFTKLATDQFTQNDTISINVLAGRLTDVGPTTVFEPANNDVYEFNLDTIYPTVKIDNFGFDNRTFPVTAEFRNSNDSIVWVRTQITTVNGGSSQTIPFPDFIPPAPGNYTFLCYTRLNIDTDKSNDTTMRSFSVRVGNDVKMNFAIKPTPLQRFPSNTPFKPEVNIKNTGVFNQITYFPAYVFAYLNGIEVYSDSTTLQLIAGDSLNVVFNKSFVPPQDGLYDLQFITALPSDQIPQNDTLNLQFVSGIEHDIAISEILFPLADSVLNLGKIYQPSCVVKNNGFKDQTTPFNVLFQALDSSQQLVQQLTKSISLNAGEERVLDFDSTWIVRPEGTITIRFISLLPTDEIPNNDTLLASVIVEKTYDYELFVTKNNIDEVLMTIESYTPSVGVKNNSRIEPDSGFVSCFIRDANNNVVYNRILKTNPPILGGETVLEFPAFTPESPGLFNVQFSVFATQDQNPFNDTALSKFNVVIRYDLEIVEQVIPQNNDTLFLDTNYPKDVTYLLKNNGLNDINNALLTLDCYDIAQTLIKSDSIQVNLNAGVSQAFVFQQFFNDVAFSIQDQNHTLIAEIRYDSSQITGNNLFEGFVFVTATSNVNSVQTEGNIKLSPNPFTQTITIENIQFNQDYQVYLYDVQGKIVVQKNVAKDTAQITLDTDYLSSGIYFLKVQVGIRTFAHKLIKH